MMDNALVNFEKAENQNRDNADLYDKWAYSLSTIGKYIEAMDKMKEAIRLDNNNENYKWKFDYYSKKFIKPDWPPDLETWLHEKERPTRVPNESPSSSGKNDKVSFNNFSSKYRVGDELNGKITRTIPKLGAFVQLTKDITGMIFWRKLPGNFDLNPRFEVGKSIRVKILRYNDQQNQIDLGFVN